MRLIGAGQRNGLGGWQGLAKKWWASSTARPQGWDCDTLAVSKGLILVTLGGCLLLFQDVSFIISEIIIKTK